MGRRCLILALTALPPADELALIDYPVRWAAELKDAFSARWPELLREDAPS